MWNQSPPPKNSLVAFYEFLKCVHSRGAAKGPLFLVLFRVVFPIPPCKKMFLHKCCVIRGVEQVKKSDNHNLFQFQNLTKPLKIGDFTVYSLDTIYGIKSAVRRFLFKIRDIPTKTKGKKSAAWWRFFYRVKKATIVPLFLPFRFFYRVSAFFTCTFLE